MNLATYTPRRTIPVCKPLLDGREAEYVAECLDTNWVSSLGEYIPRFEQRFAELTNVPHAIACSSGTAAIHLALECLDIGPGDEVIIPAFTLIVSANMVCLTGATPVLVDVRPDTWCIDPALIEAKITPRTKAIMVVHMYGHPCDMDAICAVAQRHNLYVIEDAAQAHGATYRGRTVGGIGDVGCFSFYGNKIITTGEGGMLVTRRREIADRAALLRNQAFGEERFVHHQVGFNYRMTNIQAAIGLAQCERFDEKVRRKREIAAVYDELLADEPTLQRPAHGLGCEPVWWMYGIVLKDAFGRTKADPSSPSRLRTRLRTRVQDALAARGVETRSFFMPMHRQPVFQGGHRRWPDLRGTYPVSDELGRSGLYLPSGLDLTYDDQVYVVEQLLACKR